LVCFEGELDIANFLVQKNLVYFCLYSQLHKLINIWVFFTDNLLEL
jgi:hypothetical protein